MKRHSRSRRPLGNWEDYEGEFLDAYLEAALWSTTDDNDEPLDSNYSDDDISEELLARSIKDVRKFLSDNWSTIAAAKVDTRKYSRWELAGHDFWLTRNGHGAGFWDGDWSEPAAKQLTEASKRFGEVWIEVGDDEELY